MMNDMYNEIREICEAMPCAGLPLITQVKIPWLFPDFFPIILQFSIPSDR